MSLQYLLCHFYLYCQANCKEHFLCYLPTLFLHNNHLQFYKLLTIPFYSPLFYEREGQTISVCTNLSALRYGFACNPATLEQFVWITQHFIVLFQCFCIIYPMTKCEIALAYPISIPYISVLFRHPLISKNFLFSFKELYFFKLYYYKFPFFFYFFSCFFVKLFCIVRNSFLFSTNNLIFSSDNRI